MNKAFWVLFGCVAVMPARAAGDLILNGDSNNHHTTVTQVTWLPYIPITIALIIGLVHLFYPRVGWWFKWGWQFQDPPEPSGLWLFGERLVGVAIIALTIVVICGLNGFLISFPK